MKKLSQKTFMFFGQGFGPAVAGGVSNLFGFPALFVFVGLCVMALGLLAAHFIKRNA